jgi:hypothetical protein
VLSRSAVDNDPAAAGVVQPGQELHKRCLASAVEADDRRGAADRHDELKAAEHVRLGPRVAERHMLEADVSLGQPCGPAGAAERLGMAPHAELKLVDVGQGVTICWSARS